MAQTWILSVKFELIKNIIGNVTSFSCGEQFTFIITTKGIHEALDNISCYCLLFHILQINIGLPVQIFEQTTQIKFSKFSLLLQLSSIIGLFSSGCNMHGQLGLGHDKDQFYFQKIEEIVKPIVVSCGNEHTLVLTENYCLYSCGRNSYGQLGLFDIEKTPKFSKINIKSPVNVFCGPKSTAVVTKEGLYVGGSITSSGKVRLSFINLERFETELDVFEEDDRFS